MVNQEKRQEAIRLIHEGMKCKKIADITGYSYNTIINIKKEIEDSENNEENRKKILDLYDPKIPMSVIAEKLGITLRTVKKVIKSERTSEKPVIGNTRKQGRKKKPSPRDYMKARVLALLEIGFDRKQIPTILEVEPRDVEAMEKELHLTKQITKEQAELERQRRERNAIERRKIIKKAIKAGKEQNPSVVQTHLEYSKAKFKLGTLEEADVELLTDIMMQEPQYMTPANINFISTYYTRSDKPQSAIVFLNRCIHVSEGNVDRIEMLQIAKEDVEMQMKQKQAKRMLDYGAFSDKQIANETGLTETEVIRLKNAKQATKVAEGKDDGAR